jgi:hypothetical protein
MMMQAFFFLMGGGCPAPGLRLYDQGTGDLLVTIPLPVEPGTAFAFDLAALGLSEGAYELGVTATNEYGCVSDVATIDVLVDAGGSPATDLIRPDDVTAEAIAGGEVRLRWTALGDVAQAASQVEPAEFEVAETGDLGTVLETVSWRRSRAFSVDVGAFTHGASVTLAVRASDGEVSGLRGPWVEAGAVVADSVGPDVPVIDVASLVNECDC